MPPPYSGFTIDARRVKSRHTKHLHKSERERPAANQKLQADTNQYGNISKVPTYDTDNALNQSHGVRLAALKDVQSHNVDAPADR